MRVLFASADKDREWQLASAFAAGVRAHGDEAEVCHNGDLPKLRHFDAVAMVGVKSKEIWDRTVKAGALPIMLDKGYVRSRSGGIWDYWRVSPGAHQPTSTTLMAREYPSDRLDALGLEIEPWRRRGSRIVIAGSSAKYHRFHGLPDPTSYAQALVERMHGLTDLEIVYRPKPSWREAKPVKGASYSRTPETLAYVMQEAFALVTHGSNACFEAALWGVPSIVLGDAVAAPISTTNLDRLMKPIRADRDQWLANLAYHQWTEAEMAKGHAWEIAKEYLCSRPAPSQRP